MYFKPFHLLILKLRESKITRERFIYEWGLCQWAQERKNRFDRYFKPFIGEVIGNIYDNPELLEAK